MKCIEQNCVQCIPVFKLHVNYCATILACSLKSTKKLKTWLYVYNRKKEANCIGLFLWKLHLETGSHWLSQKINDHFVELLQEWFIEFGINCRTIVVLKETNPCFKQCFLLFWKTTEFEINSPSTLGLLSCGNELKVMVG